MSAEEYKIQILGKKLYTNFFSQWFIIYVIMHFIWKNVENDVCFQKDFM
jgi:hypothetical protein